MIRMTMILVALGLWHSFSNLEVSAQQHRGERLGREAFSDHGEMPWYDAQNDSVRFVPPDESSPTPSNTPSQNGSPNRQPNNSGSSTGVSSGGLVAGGSIAAFFFWAIVVLVLVVFIVGLVWAFVKMERKEKKDENIVSLDRPSREARVEKLPFQINTTTGDLLAAARKYFSEGDYENAIIHLYSHVLVTLDEKALIRLTRGKTNRQYLMEVQKHGSIADYLERCMLPFEEAFFGARDPGQSAVARCLNEFDQFKSQLSQTSAVG